MNKVQKQAVEHTEGPVLIHAGAGSGKTRVLTYRVAYLIEQVKAKPWEILAVTFTNKAASEMKERILALSRGKGNEIWIGTFHSICARILRKEAEKIGYEKNFVIFDRDDQIRFVKTVLKQLNTPEKRFTPENVLSTIGSAKNAFVSASQYKSMAKDFFEETVADIYFHYQRMLKQNNGMDFDDLLVNPINLFQKHPDMLALYQGKFKYLLVDEYQDTNHTQYLFLKQLSAIHKNICVVGDDDQSIYRWRGADVQNILNIEKDYPGCKVFRLEQNYRSTKFILNVANSVVSNNVKRRSKELWTENGDGEKVQLVDLDDHIAEALFVVNSIKRELQKNAGNFGDFAVLYRTNAQSRVLEDALLSAGIPYILVGGVRFYQRKEIKDVLAYLRLICNSKDSVSFKRVINLPLRGIGSSSVAKIEEFASKESISLLEAAGRIEEVSSISARIRKNIFSFHQLLAKYQALKDEFTPGELARALVDEIGILRTFKEINTEESLTRYENIQELLSAVVNYCRLKEENTLQSFLEEVALMADIDTWDDRSNAVTLMTLHSAKGLEFPVVFLTGLEEGLFPITRTLNSNDELEEERRLFYVGATRAEKKLYLTWAGRRLKFGEYLQNLPSRFVGEVDMSYVTQTSKRLPNNYAPGKRKTRRPAYKVDYDEVAQEQPFYVGCEVKHPKFGLGRLLRMDGQGENAKVTVRFYDVGIKRLLLKYAKLDLLN